MIIDMHSDLLSYLAQDAGRTANDKLSRSSLPQMQQGGVKLQVLAVYTDSSLQAPAMLQSQLKALYSLYTNHSSVVKAVDTAAVMEDLVFSDDKIALLPAFENSAGFALHSASFAEVENSLNNLKKRLGPIAYISMTWDGDNRFGGGIGSKIGLKADGRHLLGWMNNHHIPIDLSHASDYLIDAIINEIDRRSYTLPILASHSNFRTITAKERNLSDTFAKEIIRRKGLIGINFFRHFSKGKQGQDILEHILYGLSLKAEASLCFGADFFCDSDAPRLKQKYGSDTFFYEELSCSSCYATVLSWMKQTLSLSADIIDAIAYKNCQYLLLSTLKKQLQKG